MDEAGINWERAMPLLWTATQLQSSTNEAPDALVTRDMGNGLMVTYAIGEDGKFRYLRQKDWSKIRMTRDDLYARAVENVADAARRSPVHMVHQGSIFVGLWAQEVPRSEAALLLVDELWDKTFKTLAPDGFIAAIPRPDVIAFCNAEEAAGIVELREMVAQAFHSTSITKALFRRHGLFWQRYSD